MSSLHQRRIKAHPNPGFHRKRRCPGHPGGCPFHGNATPPKPVRRAPAAVRKGSFATHVEFWRDGRRYRMTRAQWEQASR